MDNFKYQLLKFISFFCFALIFCSCGPSSAASRTASPTSSNNHTTPTTSVTSTPAPTVPTQTDCPPDQTARAALMPSIRLGTHPNIFFATQSNTELVFNRYDVTTGQTTQVFSLPETMQHPSPPFARLSNDGQWIIFQGVVGTQSAIQMVRVDGQEFQTLYCGGVDSFLLSPDQKTLAFNLSSGNYDLEMLDMVSGKLQTDYIASRDGSYAFAYYRPLKWQTNTSLFVMKELDGRGGSFDFSFRYNYGIFLVQDTTLDSNAQSTNLESLLIPQSSSSSSSGYCPDFDINQDQILTNDCTGGSGAAPGSAALKGPSTIQIQTLAGNASTIYNDSNNAIMYARFISDTKILFCTQNLPSSRVTQMRTSQNVGLWEINTDGTGLTQIAAFPDNSELSFTLTAYTPSYIVSRDGSQYLVTVSSYSSHTMGLFFGKLQGTEASPVPDTNQYIEATGANPYTAAIGWSTF